MSGPDVAGSARRRSWFPAMDRSPGLVLVAWLLSAGPMWVQLIHLKYAASTGPTVGLVTLGALAIVLVVPRWPTVALAVPAAALVAHRIDPVMRVGTIFTIVVLPIAWCLAIGAFVPSSWRPLRPLLAGSVVPLVVADVLLVAFNSLKVPLASTLVAFASMGVVVTRAWMFDWAGRRSRVDSPGRVTRLVRANKRFLDRLGRPLGLIAGAIAMVPAAVVVTTVWASQRLFRFEVLAPPVVGPTRWVERVDLDVDPSASFVAMNATDPRGVRRTVHRWLSVGIVVVVLAVVAYAGRPSEPVGPPANRRCTVAGRSAPDAAMDGQPGWPVIGCYTTQFSDRARFDAVTTYTFEDYRSRYVNETNGIRPTWAPPSCECRRLRVWWLGGSAAWGWYQQDMLSLPSQLAKAAWADGIALDIVNYAMPGWVFGQGVRRFAELLKTEPAPDLVMFYDGGNDLGLQFTRDARGDGRDDSGGSAAEMDLDSLLANGPFPWSIEDARREPESALPSDRMRPADVVRVVMKRYAAGVKLARTVANSVDTTPVFIWQPLLAFAPKEIGNDNALDDATRKQYRSFETVMKAKMPAGTIDMTGVLDHVGRPVFKDMFHTNEFAADVVAKDLFRRLRPTLVAVEPRSESSPSGAVGG